MNPANISFDTQNIEGIDTSSSSSSSNKKEEDKTSGKPEVNDIFKFLNKNANTILTFAIAVAIGLSLKDFMNAFVHNILQPCIMMLIMYFDTNNYLPITQSLRNKEVSIDIAKFLGSILVLKLIVGSMYFIYKYSSALF